MPISRGQMPRQLYGLGSFVKSIGKAVKGAVKGVTKAAKSPLGMTAIALAFPQVRAGLGSFFGTGSFNPLKAMITDSGTRGLGLSKFGSILSNIGLVNPSTMALTGLGKTAAFAAPSIIGGMLTPKAQEDVEALRQSGDRGLLQAYLRRYYGNLNPNARPEDIEEFVRTNSAEGGRIGYAEGNPDQKQIMAMVENMLKRGMDVETIKSITDASDEIIQDRINFIKYGGAKVPIEKAEGGRIGYARGDTAEQNAMQASGIMGLPLNENPAGVTELDLRETGGFIPPVGVKEKADDIPAMLSNNEFVFTADAVKGMGDGNVNLGAQRMYDMMKKLENGGRV